MHLYIGKKDSVKRREILGELPSYWGLSELPTGDLYHRIMGFYGEYIILTPDEERLWESRHHAIVVDLDRLLVKRLIDNSPAFSGVAESKEYPHTYGNETMVRPEIVKDVVLTKRLVQRVGGGYAHPASRSYTNLWNQLTIAEIKIANIIEPATIPPQDRERVSNTAHNDILQPLMKDEQEAIAGYEAAIKRARNGGMNHLGDFLEFIKKQEQTHLNLLRERLVKKDCEIR